MAISLKEYRAAVRQLQSQYAPTGRFTDGIIDGNINLAMHQVMLNVEWPEQTYWVQCDGTSPVIALPKTGFTSLLRVYLNGQPCSPSSQDILEGIAYQTYGGDFPNYAPTWTMAPVEGYPMAAEVSRPASSLSVPYFIGQQPTYFLKAKSALVVLPFPQAGSIVAYDCYPTVEPLINDEDEGLFPIFFKEAVAWRAIMYGFFEQGPVGVPMLQIATSAYKEQIDSILKPWKRKLVRNLPDPTVLHNSPRMFFRGPRRGPQSTSRFGG